MASREGVRFIFVQPQVGKQAVERIAQAIGGEVVVIDPLSDNVPGNMRRVAIAIRDALDQTPPPAGHHDESEHDHEH
jgi:cysteine synthase